MRKKAISVCVLLLAGYSLLGRGRKLVAGTPLEAQGTAAEASLRARAVANTQRRELPPEEYAKLRVSTLADARVRLTPKQRNPRISNRGLDPAILNTLQEQRTYLAMQSRLMSRPNPSPSAPLKDYGTGVSLPSRKDSNPRLLTQSPLSLPAGTSAPAPDCRAPMIHLVNGKKTRVVFTPQAPDNFYKIEGCFFGNVRGKLQLEPHPTVLGQSALPITLQIDSALNAWSDTKIDAHLDAGLSGIPDYPVTLVIYPGKGQRMELAGCFFVAVRGEPQLLNVIPSSWVKLQASAVGSRPIKQLEYVSPRAKGSEAPSDGAGTSAFVVRSDSEQFGFGSDTYDFSRLSPGWVVDSVQLQTYATSCPGNVTYTQSVGRWDTIWGKRGFTVNWQDDACTSQIPPVFTFDVSLSQYAARVWVIGPVGTQPVSNGLLR